MKNLLVSFIVLMIVVTVSLTTSCKHQPLSTGDVVPIDTTKKDTTKNNGGGVVVVDKGDTTGWVCSPDDLFSRRIAHFYLLMCGKRVPRRRNEGEKLSIDELHNHFITWFGGRKCQ
jgi:hypothetical protein